VVGCILRWFTCQQRVTRPGSILPRCRATLLIETSMLTTTPCRHLVSTDSLSSLFLCTRDKGQHHHVSPMSSSARPISRPRDALAALSHCCLLSVVHGYPPSAIGPSLLQLPNLEQSATCHFHTLYVCFPRSPQGFPHQAFLLMTLYHNFCSA